MFPKFIKYILTATIFEGIQTISALRGANRESRPTDSPGTGRG